MTGQVPYMTTSSDMTNTYTMFGVCGINPATPATWCSIHDVINDAEQIGIKVEQAILEGAVVPGDQSCDEILPVLGSFAQDHVDDIM